MLQKSKKILKINNLKYKKEMQMPKYILKYNNNNINNINMYENSAINFLNKKELNYQQHQDGNKN